MWTTSDGCGVKTCDGGSGEELPGGMKRTTGRGHLTSAGLKAEASTTMLQCDAHYVCAICGEPCHFKMHRDGAPLIKHVSSLEFAPRHQVQPAFLYLAL